MRLAGRISNWNDDKGYGFVTPHDGGPRAFVHIKAFQFGSRRPVDGDLISYAVSTDARGRLNAVEIRHAGQRIQQRTPDKPDKPANPANPRKPHKSHRPLPRLIIGALFVVAVCVGMVVEAVPAMVAGGYVLLSWLSYIMYAWDKDAAGRGIQRIPETTLHLVDLLGGWPGALIAQQQFRHKTVKASFQRAFWFTVLANIAAGIWLVLVPRGVG